MKPSAMILMGISILIHKNTTAMSQEPFNLRNMTCYVSSADTNDCTGIPTLHSGKLIISKNGTFKLKARYEGCFMVENITKSGKFEASYSIGTISLELLATMTKESKGAISDFPRTLGFANLNYHRLDGYFVDFSAVIHGRGRHNGNISNSKLQCEVTE